MFVDDHNEVDENGKITEWAARFMYFQKVKRPINVQYTDKNVYAFGMSYHDDKKKLAGGEEFHIEVSDDGSVRVLKECYPVHYAPGFCRMEWALPKGATIGYAYQLKKKRFTKEEVPNVHKYVEWVVKGFSEITLGSEMGMTVRVNKGNDVAGSAEAQAQPPNRARSTYVEVGGAPQPAPAPRFSAPPAEIQSPPAGIGAQTALLLQSAGYTEQDIAALTAAGVVQ